MIGCIVTLLTCGVLIGNTQGDVRGLIKDVDKVSKGYESLAQKQSDMKSKQAYLEGVVTVQLKTIQEDVKDIREQVNNLVRVP